MFDHDELHSKKRFKEVEKISLLGTWEWNMKSNNLVWSDKTFRIFGEEAQSFEPTFDQFMSYLDKENQRIMQKNISSTIDSKTTSHTDFKIMQRGGDIRYLHSTALAEFNEKGEPVSMIGTVLDLTERYETENKLISLGRIVENSFNEIYIFDIESLHFTYLNQAAQNKIGYTLKEMECLTPLDIKVEYTMQSFLKLLEPIKNGSKTYLSFNTTHRCKDGSDYIAEIRLQSIKTNGKKQFVVIAQDITQRIQLEEELKLYHSAVDQSTSSIYITDQNALIEYANPQFYKVTGYHPEDIIGKNPHIFYSGKQSDTFYMDLWDTILSGNSWHGEIVNKYKDGRQIDEITSISPIKDKEGNIKHFIAVKEDITELKGLQDKLAHQAYFDMLTNIPNRTLFFHRLDKTLAISKRKKHSFGLLFIDLDGFKNINDNYGHAIGDNLLIEVSKKIQSCIRESDTVARMGGDEFIVLLSEIASNDEPGITAERIIDMLIKPFQISGHTCNIGASIGISIYPDHSSNLDELLALADKAMYEVKSTAKSNYRYAK